VLTVINRMLRYSARFRPIESPAHEVEYHTIAGWFDWFGISWTYISIVQYKIGVLFKKLTKVTKHDTTNWSENERATENRKGFD
jgi:hypothetical protein